jgi:hypothetical protein
MISLLSKDNSDAVLVLRQIVDMHDLRTVYPALVDPPPMLVSPLFPRAELSQAHLSIDGCRTSGGCISLGA